jgi:hypothetical protein
MYGDRSSGNRTADKDGTTTEFDNSHVKHNETSLLVYYFEERKHFNNIYKITPTKIISQYLSKKKCHQNIQIKRNNFSKQINTYLNVNHRSRGANKTKHLFAINGSTVIKPY